MIAHEARACLQQLATLGVQPLGLSADSRTIKPGDLFLAYPGIASDGRSYIAQALARGASAVVRETSSEPWPGAISAPHLEFRGLRDAVGHFADALLGERSRRLWIACVTGTNGKTTVSQWIARALGELGHSCGVIGTLGCGFPGALSPGLHTTPDAVDMHRALAAFLADGAVAAAAEVSSVGIDQGRIAGVRFNLAIHTNLTRDHLDYHGTMERYAAAKARFLDLPGLDAVILNVDDAFGLSQARRLHERGERVIAYSRVRSNRDAVPGAAFLLADELSSTAAGQQFVLDWQGQRIPMHPRSVGAFNVSNLLAVIAALLMRGCDLAEAAAVAARMTPPEGRMQLLGGIGEPLVVVDYAHTPDALQQVLEAARASAAARHGRLICVFGCGGDRDPGKRPLMGEVAAGLADRVIITSDNPRSEEALRIIADIAAGAPLAEEEVDRPRAIAMAIAGASANDVVLLAGKGHEPYQEILGQRIPYSDLVEARKALAAWAGVVEARP